MYLITSYSPHAENLVHLANDWLKINRLIFKFLTTELWLGSQIRGETWKPRTPLIKSWPQMSFTKEFSREKVNACKLLEGATASHAGSLGRPGKEGFGKARSAGRRAQSAKRGHLRSLDHEHRSSQDISEQWGHTAPQGHRNRATLHNLPPRRQAPALHSRCGRPAGTDRLGTRVGSPDGGDPERWCQEQGAGD